MPFLTGGVAIAAASVAVYRWSSRSGKAKRAAPLVESCNGLSLSHYVNDLMVKAKMEALTHEQELFCQSLEKSRQSHVTVSTCKFITAEFVARAKSGEDLSYLARRDGATMTAEAANAVVKEKVIALHEQILKCDDVIYEKKQHYVNLAELLAKIDRISRRWDRDLRSLGKRYGTTLSKIKGFMNDDIEVADSARSQRDALYERIRGSVEELQREIDEVSEPPSLTFSKETIQASRSMLEGIIYSSNLEALQKKEMAEAIKEVDKLLRRYFEAYDTLEREQVDVEVLSKEIMQDELAIKRQVASLEADLAFEMSVKDRGGQGEWLMKGTPSDPTSERLKAAWDADQQSQLREYKCGSFEIRLNPKCTKSQREVRENIAAIEEALKKKRNSTDDLKAKKEERAQKKQSVRMLIDVCRKAHRDYSKAERNLEVGVLNLPPAHRGQILGLQRVSEAMSQTAKTFQPARAEMENFQMLLDELRTLLEDKDPLKAVREVVTTISAQVNDKEASSVIVLKRLGEAALNDFLLPAIDPAATRASLLADEGEQQATECVPVECD